MLKKSVAAALALLFFTGCAADTSQNTGGAATSGSQATESSSSLAGADTVTCNYIETGDASKEVKLPESENIPATGTEDISLTLGGEPVVITLDRAAAPCTSNSFESLAVQGYYDGTKCHRLSDSGSLYMLQCGDPTGSGMGGPGYSYDDELEGITGYPAGTVAMANAGPNTNGSQFFLVYEETNLPPSYTVFGHLDKAGLAVVQKIAEGGSDGSNSDGTGLPLVDATIDKVTVG